MWSTSFHSISSSVSFLFPVTGHLHDSFPLSSCEASFVVAVVVVAAAVVHHHWPLFWWTKVHRSSATRDTFISFPVSNCCLPSLVTSSRPASCILLLVCCSLSLWEVAGVRTLFLSLFTCLFFSPCIQQQLYHGCAFSCEQSFHLSPQNGQPCVCACHRETLCLLDSTYSPLST